MPATCIYLVPLIPLTKTNYTASADIGLPCMLSASPDPLAVVYIYHWFKVYYMHANEFICGFFFPVHAALGTPATNTPFSFSCPLLDCSNTLCSSNINDFEFYVPGMEPVLILVAFSAISLPS